MSGDTEIGEIAKSQRHAKCQFTYILWYTFWIICKTVKHCSTKKGSLKQLKLRKRHLSTEIWKTVKEDYNKIYQRYISAIYNDFFKLYTYIRHVRFSDTNHKRHVIYIYISCIIDFFFFIQHLTFCTREPLKFHYHIITTHEMSRTIHTTRWKITTFCRRISTRVNFDHYFLHLAWEYDNFAISIASLLYET